MDGITESMDMNLSKLQETVKDRGVWHIAVHGITKSGIQCSNLTSSLIHYTQIHAAFIHTHTHTHTHTHASTHTYLYTKTVSWF